ncbi:MAG: paraslipin [Spirochaetales bacterium]|nr:paraslipin [Spirochaetales bacterium]
MFGDILSLGSLITLVLIFAWGLIKSIRIVPAQNAYIVERLGKYNKTLEAGFHILIPFMDKVRYKHSLKERAIDVPSQPCFTKDNVKVEVDGVLYLKVVDPKLASYGINQYLYAARLMAQTTMRSVIGKIDLDKAFEEREMINAQVVKSVDDASDPWGVKVTRYEIQNIRVPREILSVMEVQMEAERVKRADIAKSEGDKQSRINYSLGVMEEAINKSEGEKQRLINEAEGKAKEIEALALATAAGIDKVAQALQSEGGDDAVALRLSENYIGELKKLANEKTDIIMPLNLGDISSIIQSIKSILQENK